LDASTLSASVKLQLMERFQASKYHQPAIDNTIECCHLPVFFHLLIACEHNFAMNCYCENVAVQI
jgi:hypothetical protein